MLDELHRSIRLLYHGRSVRARRFRYGLIAFDAGTIFYFVFTAAVTQTPLLHGINVVLGLLILADLSARLWVSPHPWQELRRIYTIADILVISTLLLAPLLTDELAFLRILRGLRLIHSYHLIRDLRQESRFFRLYEDSILAAVHLFVFIFVTTSFVFAFAFEETSGAAAYIDALYFTVATLTTTGFGDITMTTPGGKLLSVFIMIVGVALFFQLARAVIQPSKVHYKCTECGLTRHDQDAVHCKHCGSALKIETGGGAS